jgi:hypothetical protein
MLQACNPANAHGVYPDRVGVSRLMQKPVELIGFRIRRGRRECWIAPAFDLLWLCECLFPTAGTEVNCPRRAEQHPFKAQLISIADPSGSEILNHHDMAQDVYVVFARRRAKT